MWNFCEVRYDERRLKRGVREGDDRKKEGKSRKGGDTSSIQALISSLELNEADMIFEVHLVF